MRLRDSSKASFWRHHVMKYKASGQTRIEYCRHHGLKVDQLAYRIGQYNRDEPSESNGFAQVVVAESPSINHTGCARLIVSSGVVIEFSAGTDPGWIARLVLAVGGRS